MSSNEIYVIDGQNEEQISNYWSNNTNIMADHPCLPQPFDEFNSTDISVTISFNLSLITNMSAWYPQICRNGEINNKYMFAANKSNLILNNLIIDLYEFNDINFGIIGVVAEYKSYGAESELVCNNCTFTNIKNNNNEITLIYSTKNILFNNCLFTHIESINAFIVMGFKSFQMYGVIVEHCIFNESFLFIQDTGTGFESVFNDITFENCQFNHIYSQIALIEDQWYSCELSMYNVDFLNINQGSIYRARYEFGSHITMEYINISTPQSIACTSADCTVHSLFDFNFASSVHIDHMNVDYYYDINANCYTESNGNGHSDALGDVSYLKMECANPVSLLINQIGSQMTINNTDFRINITQSDAEYGYNYTVMFYLDVANHAVVVNYGDLSIANLNIYGLPFGRRFLSNFNILNIEAFRVVMADFDPNALQSRIIIKQTASSATMTVRHSHFVGGSTAQINIYAGSAAIYDCVFEKGSEALWVQAAANIVMSRCRVLRLGRYWSHILKVLGIGGGSNDLFTVELQKVQQTALIEKSTFSGFEDTEWGLFIYAAFCQQVVLRNNVFVVNATDLYYSIPANKISIKGAVRGLVYFYVNYKVLIYGNDFYKNEVNPNIPWLFLHYNGNWNYFDGDMTPETTCLSANNFSNYAFEALQNGVTSCFRQELYLCGNAETDCKEGEYGQIDAELYDKTSHFNINADIASFFTANNYGLDFVHAMDNIQIHILSESANYKLYLPYTRILILDSIFSANAAILYDDNCDVVRNERLLWVDSTEYIAKLKIICDVYGNETENYRNLNETNVTYVAHLSPTQIEFVSTSTTYFPGQKLKFDYKIFDKLENEYNEYLFDDNASQFIVNLENSPLSLYENIQIEENGTCRICDSGVIILGVALNDVLISNDSNSNSLFIQTSIVTENLALMDNMIGLDVTSCPVGYGADGNGYQCHLCPDNTYNLLANSTEPCKDCQEHENNKGNVRCYFGEIYIKKDYWLGIENEDIISQQCPSSYCCDPAQDGDEYCNYIENYQSDDAAILCAENRDLSVPLCGKCMEGYTESINSPKCMICDEYNYIWLIKPLLFAFIYAGYLVFFHPKKELNANTDTNTKTTANEKESLSTSVKQLFANKDVVLMGQTLALRVLLYYEQALGSILWPSSSSRFMSSIYAVAALFNLETIAPNSGREPQCFIDGLNSKKKILLGLFSWAIVVTLLLLTFTFESYRHFCCPNRCKVLNTNFPKAFLQFLIICVGQLLSVAFKLLNCQTVGSKRVHFYFGEEECGATWTVYVSLFVIIFVFVVFTAMWLAMRRVTEEERENPNYYLNGVCKYYKPQCYYWEFVALTRRTLISAFAILYTFNWFAPCLIAALLICLGLHHKYQPFRDNDSNVAEYVALSCVIVVVSIQMTITYVGSLSFVTSVFLTLFIIVPIIAVIIIVLIVAKKGMGRKHSKQSVVYHQPSMDMQPSIAIDINEQGEEMKNDGGQNVELQTVSSVAQYLQANAGDQSGDHFINASGGGASLNSATIKTLEPLFKQCISIEDDDESVLFDDGVVGKQSVRV